MKNATMIFNWLIRITGILQLIVGVIFWVNQNDALVPFHILIGSVLVISLWILAFLAGRAGVSSGSTVLAFALGLIVLVLGLTQTQILPGGFHWVIEVIHLVIGMGAVGQGEGLMARIKRVQAGTS